MSSIDRRHVPKRPPMACGIDARASARRIGNRARTAGGILPPRPYSHIGSHLPLSAQSPNLWPLRRQSSPRLRGTLHRGLSPRGLRPRGRRPCGLRTHATPTRTTRTRTTPTRRPTRRTTGRTPSRNDPTHGPYLGVSRIFRYISYGLGHFFS